MEGERGYHIALNFHGSKFLIVIFEEIISLHRHKSIDGQCSGAKLPNPQGKLFKEMYTFDVAIALLTAASSSGQL